MAPTTWRRKQQQQQQQQQPRQRNQQRRGVTRPARSTTTRPKQQPPATTAAAAGEALLPLESCMCPVCLDILVEPVTMPCGHSLCAPCFAQCVEKAALCCPLCRARVSSWARRRAREPGGLLDAELWSRLRAQHPERCLKRMRERGDGGGGDGGGDGGGGDGGGGDDDGGDGGGDGGGGDDDGGDGGGDGGGGDDDGPLFQAPVLVSRPGEVRREYQEQYEKLQAERLAQDEEERRLSERLIAQLMEDEQQQELAARAQQEAMDSELARRLSLAKEEKPVQMSSWSLMNQRSRSKTLSPRTPVQESTSVSKGIERFLSPVRTLPTSPSPPVHHRRTGLSLQPGTSAATSTTTTSASSSGGRWEDDTRHHHHQQLHQLPHGSARSSDDSREGSTRQQQQQNLLCTSSSNSRSSSSEGSARQRRPQQQQQELLCSNSSNNNNSSISSNSRECRTQQPQLLPHRSNSSNSSNSNSSNSSRDGGASSGGDSITQELNHFKPIVSCPRTPPKQLPDGRVLSPALVKATPIKPTTATVTASSSTSSSSSSLRAEVPVVELVASAGRAKGRRPCRALAEGAWRSSRRGRRADDDLELELPPSLFRWPMAPSGSSATKSDGGGGRGERGAPGIRATTRDASGAKRHLPSSSPPPPSSARKTNGGVGGGGAANVDDYDADTAAAVALVRRQDEEEEERLALQEDRDRCLARRLQRQLNSEAKAVDRSAGSASAYDLRRQRSCHLAATGAAAAASGGGRSRRSTGGSRRRRPKEAAGDARGAKGSPAGRGPYRQRRRRMGRAAEVKERVAAVAALFGDRRTALPTGDDAVDFGAAGPSK
ncbi:E3 ubiquitin-protein ligase RNF169-like [Lethenteron reissneri]|uniref:E3 ubiquitin-protein ligase RNF169-like n=1 Tax=Lethenteron reissneri TaxID=7753 RepID=UPI002AB68596|nr:E3 ubiquitin-protein ligase RNF169-like [Lethenteron reissneri]